MKKKTVFVIGAGASHEFGLPLGSDLKDQIAKDLDFRWNGSHLEVGSDTILEAIQQEYGRDTEEARTAIQQANLISRGMVTARSIDNFIHQHQGNKHLEFVGKLAIANRIFQAERASSLYVEDTQRHRVAFENGKNAWLVELFMLITETASVNDLPVRFANLTFIVFNYDRCLEHGLKWALQNHYNISEAKAEELVASLVIYHPYGQIGALPWIGAHRMNYVDHDFGGKASLEHLLCIARDLRTFTEGTAPQGGQIEAIRTATTNADQFVFLGFAYHSMNLAVLFDGTKPTTGSRRWIFGTSIGISAQNELEIRKALETKAFVPKARLNLEHCNPSELLSGNSLALSGM